jgi:lactate dehydrogenase-like 2-hydroxyacid dehydrogenase
MRILITRPVPPCVTDPLRAAGHEVIIPGQDSPEHAAAILAGTSVFHGIIPMNIGRIDGPFLDAHPALKAVSNLAVGYNNIDVPACTARGVGCSNTPGVLNNATAEIAFGLMLCAARRLGESERCVRAGRWVGWGSADFVGTDVCGQTLGILGAGRIGSRVARMAQGFDMRLVYHNRQRSPEMDILGAAWVAMDDLFRQADFVSVHVPLNDATHHLVGARALALMKPTAIFINTSRGAVVDEAALFDALRSRRIFSAGLDVYENEPALHPGLAQLENVVLLSHIGSATAQTRRKMGELAAANLLAMLDGKKPLTPLNPELWE